MLPAAVLAVAVRLDEAGEGLLGGIRGVLGGQAEPAGEGLDQTMLNKPFSKFLGL